MVEKNARRDQRFWDDEAAKLRSMQDPTGEDETTVDLRLTTPLNVTLPPYPDGDLDAESTEDAMPLAEPVCDRGTLTMVNGPDAGSIYRLGSVTVVGRSPECDIRITDLGASRRHARIVQESETHYTVHDLGSRNGTTIAGRRITQHALADGDRLGMGPAFFRFTLTDAVEESALKRRYETSIADGLTGALNRRHFDHRLVGELAFAKRHKVELSLLLLDVDHFKEVNDTFGHAVGDAALKHLTETIRRALRVEDVFARYGGEEFAIIARGIDGPHAYLLGDRVRKIVETTPFGHEAFTIPLTVSIGVASLADCKDASVDQLINQADRRLYFAKNSGRNRCKGA